MAIKFAQMGEQVLICARSASDLAALANTPATEGRIRYQVCDVLDRTQVQAFGAYALDTMGGRIDVLINNAGVFLPGSIAEEAEGVLEQQIHTNLYSAYHLTRALLPAMKSALSGHIFNICSTASLVGYPNGGSYCISKFALHGLTKVLREELLPYQIKVSGVFPGAVLTRSWSGTEEPASRFILPEDIAELVWTASRLSIGACMEEILIRPLAGDFD